MEDWEFYDRYDRIQQLEKSDGFEEPAVRHNPLVTLVAILMILVVFFGTLYGVIKIIDALIPSYNRIVMAGGSL